MDEEFDLEEVVICSFVDSDKGFTEAMARNPHKYLKVSALEKSTTTLPESVKSEEFVYSDSHQLTFLRNNKEKYTYQITQSSEDKYKRNLYFSRKSAPSKEIRHQFTEVHRKKCGYSVWYNCQYWTVMIYTNSGKERRFIAIDLDTVEILGDFTLPPLQINNYHWKVFQVTNDSVVVRTAAVGYGGTAAYYLSTFDLKTGIEKASDEISLKTFNGLQLQSNIYSYEGKTLERFNMETLTSDKSLDIESFGDGMTIRGVSTIDQYLLVTTEQQKDPWKRAYCLVDRELCKVVHTLALPDRFQYGIYLTNVIKRTLFTWRGHEFRVIGTNYKGLMPKSVNNLLLLSQVRGKLILSGIVLTFDFPIGVRDFQSVYQKNKRTVQFRLTGYIPSGEGYRRFIHSQGFASGSLTIKARPSKDTNVQNLLV